MTDHEHWSLIQILEKSQMDLEAFASEDFIYIFCFSSSYQVSTFVFLNLSHLFSIFFLILLFSYLPLSLCFSFFFNSLSVYSSSLLLSLFSSFLAWSYHFWVGGRWSLADSHWARVHSHNTSSQIWPAQHLTHVEMWRFYAGFLRWILLLDESLLVWFMLSVGHLDRFWVCADRPTACLWAIVLLF